jgi:hypothetical protein
MREFVATWTFEDTRENSRASVRQMLPFKRGWLVTLAAFEQFIPYLFEMTDAKFFSPRRLNQDVAENTMCQVTDANL